jgi:hypothetical protein
MNKKMTLDEMSDLYASCVNNIVSLKKAEGMYAFEIGKYCAIVRDNHLWEIKDPDSSEPMFRSFEAWIADPDHGPGIGRRNVYSYMRFYRMATYLKAKYNIAVETFYDIGSKKLIYLMPYIQKEIEKDNKEAIEKLLIDGATMSFSSLETETEQITKLRGEGILVIDKDKDHIVIFPTKWISEFNTDSDGKKIIFFIRELRKRTHKWDK